jgi:hypothetical protein
MKPAMLFIVNFIMLMLLSCSPPPPPLSKNVSGNVSKAWPKIPGLPDISGLEWISGNDFLAVHDAKFPIEKNRPRISLIKTKNNEEGITWTSLQVNWPASSGPSSDLESIARIPGTRNFLLAESGNDGDRYSRIFLSSLGEENQFNIQEVIDWPVKIFNVEASAVLLLNGQLYFLYSERSHGRKNTELKWAKMHLNPLRFESFQSASYAAGMTGTGLRSVVALDADKDGNLYSVTAYDPGDSGPFRSYVSRIGSMKMKNDSAFFIPSGKFADILTLDGNKIEGLTIREKKGREIFIGTDDENLGASFGKID